MSSMHTVHGPIDIADAGKVMMHEHPLSLTPGPWMTAGQNRDADQVSLAVRALAPLRDLGYGTVVDLSPYGVVGRSDDGANVALLREISERSGLHIVAGTSVYLEAYSPEWARDASLDQLTATLIADLTRGIGDSGVRAGILGEQATGFDEITAHEEKALRAAARAQRATGVALMTHTTHATMAMEQLAVLQDEGVDPSRVVVGHMDIHPDPGAVFAVLDAGAAIAIDTIGKQHWDFFLAPPPAERVEGEYAKRAYFRSDRSRAQLLVDIAARGQIDQVVLAQDLTGAEVYMNPHTHGQAGYAYLSEVFIPMACELGLDPHHVDTLLRANPARLLTPAAAA
ncbi:phosphotriesterase family protein [Demequina globuliformis]|uniref:phosphotriesterase family protein n=1 Tax=Demequina globuliformis TaxID=676202 RepID=UPI00078201BF|nr:aryldialkylphosphatase [Demequina globuliformis]